MLFCMPTTTREPSMGPHYPGPITQDPTVTEEGNPYSTAVRFQMYDRTIRRATDACERIA